MALWKKVLGKMIRSILKTCLIVMAFLITASVSVAAECADDPNECTPKKLCETATNVVANNIVWSIRSSDATHVTFAQGLGMSCGVVAIVNPCDLDPNECKITQLCEKATKIDKGQAVWNSAAQGYVDVAKEYELTCDVKAENAAVKTMCSKENPELCNGPTICQLASSHNSKGYYDKSKSWSKTSSLQTYVKEAKKRGLTCGIGAKTAAVTKSQWTCSAASPEECTVSILCGRAVRKRSSSGGKIEWMWQKSQAPYVKEAKKRGLTCGVNAEKTIVYDTFVTSKFTGHGAGEVTIGVADKTTVWNGERFYSWPSGAALFKSDYRAIDLGTYRPNGDTNTIFSAVTRQFQQQSLSQRKTIQRNLKNKNLYSSSVDGVWGRNTLIALVDYSSKRLRTVDLRSNAIVSILLKEIKQDYLHTTKPVADYVLANVKKDQAKVNKLLVQNSDLKKVFGRLSVLEKKQMQYALKKLGFYRGAVDAIWGKNTDVALSNFITSQQVKPKNALFVLTEKVTVPNSFAAAPQSSSSSSSSASSSSGGSNAGNVLRRGAAVTLFCTFTPSAAACLDGAMGNSSNYGSSGSSSSSSTFSSSTSSDKQCSFDSQCGFRGKCVKRFGKSMCVKIVDEDGRKVRDRDAEPATCRRNSDCSRKFKCNRQLRICVAK